MSGSCDGTGQPRASCYCSCCIAHRKVIYRNILEANQALLQSTCVNPTDSQVECTPFAVDVVASCNSPTAYGDNVAHTLTVCASPEKAKCCNCCEQKTAQLCNQSCNSSFNCAIPCNLSTRYMTYFHRNCNNCCQQNPTPCQNHSCHVSPAQMTCCHSPSTRRQCCNCVNRNCANRPTSPTPIIYQETPPASSCSCIFGEKLLRFLQMQNSCTGSTGNFSQIVLQTSKN